jgi:putative lipase involved disintegration of autophagic bodies
MLVFSLSQSLSILILISVSVVVAASLNAGQLDDITNDSQNKPSFTFSLKQEFSLEDNYLLGEETDEKQSHFTVTNLARGKPPTRLSATLQARPTSIWRPRDPKALQHARLRSLKHSESVPVEWEEVQMLGPDVEDRHTLGQLARMTGNAYALPGQKNWYDIDKAWNTVSASFGFASQRKLIVSLYSRAFPSAGKTQLTASEDMSFYHRRMQQSYSV